MGCRTGLDPAKRPGLDPAKRPEIGEKLLSNSYRRQQAKGATSRLLVLGLEIDTVLTPRRASLPARSALPLRASG